MIIKTLDKIANGARLIRFHSNQLVYLRRVGTDIIMPEAIEVEGSENEYEETDIAIEPIVASDEDMLSALERLGITNE